MCLVMSCRSGIKYPMQMRVMRENGNLPQQKHRMSACWKENPFSSIPLIHPFSFSSSLKKLQAHRDGLTSSRLQVAAQRSEASRHHGNGLCLAPCQTTGRHPTSTGSEAASYYWKRKTPCGCRGAFKTVTMLPITYRVK